MSDLVNDQFVRPDIVNMEAYEPIVPLEILARRLGLSPEQIVKLDANENPYGPSPKVLVALASAGSVHLYPDPQSIQLRQAISATIGVPKERLLAGAGADELIDLTARAVVSPGDTIVNCPPTFGMYSFAATLNSAMLVNIPRHPDFSLDVAAIEQAVLQNRAKLLFICSPNNPNGGLIDDSLFLRLLALPTLVVLDEAYIEFAQALDESVSSRMGWVLDYDNLVVLRTFSKLAGLAGLRVGYGAFPEWLISHLWKIKQPYNVSITAAAAALAALQDRAWMEDKVSLLAQEQKRLASMLAEIKFLDPYPSQANFVLCRVIGRDARALKVALEKEGILVRHFAKPGLENSIRISAGKPADSRRLIETLKKMEE